MLLDAEDLKKLSALVDALNDFERGSTLRIASIIRIVYGEDVFATYEIGRFEGDDFAAREPDGEAVESKCSAEDAELS